MKSNLEQLLTTLSEMLEIVPKEDYDPEIVQSYLQILQGQKDEFDLSGYDQALRNKQYLEDLLPLEEQSFQGFTWGELWDSGFNSYKHMLSEGELNSYLKTEHLSEFADIIETGFDASIGLSWDSADLAMWKLFQRYIIGQ